VHGGHALICMLMEWSSLRDFLALAEHGSVSRASKLLGLSQPALSRRLLRLEEELDAPLFLRSPRGLQLTAAGERVLAVAKRMREVADEVEEAAGQGHDPGGGVVRISAPEAGLGTDWLPRVLLPLRREQPDLILEIHIENQVVDLARGASDIAIRGLRPVDPVLTARRVAKIGWALFAACSYLERSPSPGTSRELAEHDLLIYEQTFNVRQAAWFERLGLSERVVLRSTSVDALISATRAGWGIALLPGMIGDADPLLRRVLPALEVGSMPLWLATHADLRKSPRIRSVFQFLGRCFERDRNAFAARGAARGA
jgi:DNA-binding transcriptional LysR family regulator